MLYQKDSENIMTKELHIIKEDFMTVADKVINELFHANMMIE